MTRSEFVQFARNGDRLWRSAISSSSERTEWNYLTGYRVSAESFVKHSRAIVSIFYLLCKPGICGCASRKLNFEIHRSIQVNCYARRLPRLHQVVIPAEHSRCWILITTVATSKFHRDMSIYIYI